MLWKQLVSKRPRHSQTLITALSALTLIVGVAGLTGCSKQQFVKQQTVSNISPVGARTLPAKVDILLVPDNTSSVNVPFSTLQANFAAFIASISNSWDYHVASALTVGPAQNTAYPIDWVLVNSTYNSNTLPDGTQLPNTGIVPNDRAITNPANFQILGGTQQTGGDDYTYQNTYQALQAAKNDTYTNFLRPDALLVIIVITNGAEFTVDPTHTNQINQTALQTAANNFIAIKGASSLIRYYPIASYSYRTGAANDSCLVPGGTAWIGGSYFQMNSLIQGLPQYDSSGNEQLDFCNTASLNNVLNDISANLQAVQEQYVFSNIVLTAQPIVDSKFQVLKNGSAIAQDHKNGWSYPCDTCNANGFGSVYTITAIQNQNGTIVPLTPPLAERSGYVIQLNGSARMVGSDTYQVVHSNN